MSLHQRRRLLLALMPLLIIGVVAVLLALRVNPAGARAAPGAHGAELAQAGIWHRSALVR